MTMINTATPRFSTTFAAPALSRIFARFSAAWAARAERRETYQALSVLSDRELEDIGLVRSDVEALR